MPPQGIEVKQRSTFLMPKSSFKKIPISRSFYSARKANTGHGPKLYFPFGSPLRTEQMEDLNIKTENDWKLHQGLNSPWPASDPPCWLCSLGPGASWSSIVQEMAQRPPGAGSSIRSPCRMHCAAQIRPDLYSQGPCRVRKSWPG